MNHPSWENINSSTLIIEGLKNIGVCDNSIVLLAEHATVHPAHTLMGIALHCSDILTEFLTLEDTKDINIQEDEL